MNDGRELWMPSSSARFSEIVCGGLSRTEPQAHPAGRRGESVVENYLGFPNGLSGQSLLDRGRVQVRRFSPYIRVPSGGRPAEMIIAVGQGATAGQTIDRDLFDESLQCHRLPWMGTNEAWVAGASSEMEGWR